MSLPVALPAIFAQAIGVPMGALRLVTYEGGGGVPTAIIGGVIDTHWPAVKACCLDAAHATSAGV